MNNQSATRKPAPGYLSVVPKSYFSIEQDSNESEDLVLQTDLYFNITALNTPARLLFERSANPARNIFDLGDIEIVNGSLDEIKQLLFNKGFWTGKVFYKRFDGFQLHYKTTAAIIRNDEQAPTGILLVCTSMQDEKDKENQLDESRKQFDGLLNSLSSGVMMIGADGNILSSNRKGAEILGLADMKVIGLPVASKAWKAIRPDGSVFPPEQFPAIVSLQTGFPQRNVVMGLGQSSAGIVWLSVSSEALIKPGEFEPYAVVVSFSDITSFVNTENELKESNERFKYVSKITSDAIWDFDLAANTIYRSDAFSRISGYPKNEICNNIDWWFDHIHPDDKNRVKEKLDEQLRRRYERWEDEYRFCYADGSYKLLHDSGIILYKEGKPARIIGAIRDITEQTRLKQQLAEEQAQKQKAITKATLNAQEEEKAKISRELHDNVNQILMSAKLYMETARQSAENSDKLLEKAIEYQLLALHEIRKLSKSLNTAAITAAGLRESIGEIVRNLEMLQNIRVELAIDSETEKRLSEKEKLTIYRTVQEQTNNIIKYAEATVVGIAIRQQNGNIVVSISDNGRGFDMHSKESFSGIGLINMNSRAVAHGGTFEIISSPGNGCTIILSFPFEQ